VKALLAGTAMLLALCPAYADWQCGKVKVEVNKLTSDHLAEVRFEGFFKDLLASGKIFPGKKPHNDGFKFEMTKDGGAKLNGKRCKEIDD
jgi:hypothetical protein